MMARWNSIAVMAFAAMIGSSCGGGSSPTQPTPTRTTPPPTLQATLSSIQANVFTPRCVACHTGATPEGGMRLSAGDAYTNLVNVSSSQRALMRVVPGSSASSYLIHKIEGQADIVGLRMPPPPLLSAEVIQVIRAVDRSRRPEQLTAPDHLRMMLRGLVAMASRAGNAHATATAPSSVPAAIAHTAHGIDGSLPVI